MEQDMDLDLANVLCAKVDEHAGDWPSQSFVDLFLIANQCVQPKMTQRAEVALPENRIVMVLIGQC